MVSDVTNLTDSAGTNRQQEPVAWRIKLREDATGWHFMGKEPPEKAQDIFVVEPLFLSPVSVPLDLGVHKADVAPTVQAHKGSLVGEEQAIGWLTNNNYEPTEAMMQAGLETNHRHNSPDNLRRSFKEMMLQAELDGLVRMHFRPTPSAGWQPIETAPKDAPILAYRPPSTFGKLHTIVAVIWSPEAGMWVWPDEPYDAYCAYDYHDAEAGDDFYQGAEFTHWMPLPSSPTVEGTETAGGDQPSFASEPNPTGEA